MSCYCELRPRKSVDSVNPPSVSAGASVFARRGPMLLVLSDRGEVGRGTGRKKGSAECERESTNHESVTLVMARNHSDYAQFN